MPGRYRVRHLLVYPMGIDPTVCSYDPGDVAVIHPEASPIDVETFLTTLGWSNAADDPIRIQRVFEGSFTSRHQ
jgi:sulfite reductase alpha subunit-like flavoprotein